MATKRLGHSPAPKQLCAAVSKGASQCEACRVDSKSDSVTYVRLCTLGATQRRTNQDILSEAVLSI
jgi:hypothetical protein